MIARSVEASVGGCNKVAGAKKQTKGLIRDVAVRCSRICNITVTLREVAHIFNPFLSLEDDLRCSCLWVGCLDSCAVDRNVSRTR
jgi:hypothetical protein